MNIAICDDVEVQLRYIEKFTSEYLCENELAAEIFMFNHPDKLMSALEKDYFQIYIFLRLFSNPSFG